MNPEKNVGTLTLTQLSDLIETSDSISQEELKDIGVAHRIENNGKTSYVMPSPNDSIFYIVST